MLYIIKIHDRILALVEGETTPEPIYLQYDALRRQWDQEYDNFEVLLEEHPQTPRKPANITFQDFIQTPIYQSWEEELKQYCENSDKVKNQYQLTHPKPNLQSMLETAGYKILEFEVVPPTHKGYD